jgi:hypothetical protein
MIWSRGVGASWCERELPLVVKNCGKVVGSRVILGSSASWAGDRVARRKVRGSGAECVPDDDQLEAQLVEARYELGRSRPKAAVMRLG